MKQVTSRFEFDVLNDKVKRLFHIHLDLPSNVFREASQFVFLDFDAYAVRSFYEAFIGSSGSFFFFTAAPDPIDYFNHHFEEFGSFTFSSDSSYSAYIDLLHLEPRGGNSADSIISRADVIVLSSDDGRISAFGDRALNCLIVGFRDAKTKADFIQLFGRTHIYTLQEAIKRLLPPNYKGKDVFESNFKVS
jgi:hypothetical protein